MTWIDFLGYAASATVLATFCMSTMIPLRVTAILSNLLFALFGFRAHIYPVMMLHLILLPVNVLRLMQIRHLVRRTSQSIDLSMENLVPLMTRRRFRAGETMIRKGDPADRLFYLAHGQVEVAEFGKTISSGTVLGEIGVFARDQRRMASIICRTDCEVYELSESKAKELYYQDPSFGYAVLQMVISRLMEDMNALAEIASRAKRTARRQRLKFYPRGTDV
jgi:CRP/FNR family transcriptional regulator, cyclic AMP receptor protein